MYDQSPPSMTAEDLDKWCEAIDGLAQADQARGVIRNGVISAGQAAVDVINARRRDDQAGSSVTAAALSGAPTGTHSHPSTHPSWMEFADGACIVCDAQRAGRVTQ